MKFRLRLLNPFFFKFSYFKDNYTPNVWAANGPLLVTNILRNICGTKETIKMTRANCEGFHVYDANYFYAISFYNFFEAFDINPLKVINIFGIIKNSTIAHMSNTLSHGWRVEIGSPVAYGKLAEKYCPNVYNSHHKYF